MWYLLKLLFQIDFLLSYDRKYFEFKLNSGHLVKNLLKYNKEGKF